ncbi:MAG TPA: DUF2512 family protein [Firmicutes bacterium]|jgi:hypothetical protein|nr:MAG: hypothetical protein AA931_12110 [Peptococcaceae bacterium 1109]HHT73809.1 DUF2512 family protein [Bacillota bacterium]
MRNTAWAVLLKFAFTFAAGLLTSALFDNNTWLAVLGWALTAAAVNFFLGDLFLLPSLGSALAAVADGVVGAGLAWLFALVFSGFRATGATVIALGVLIALVEHFFHAFAREARATSS